MSKKLITADVKTSTAKSPTAAPDTKEAAPACVQRGARPDIEHSVVIRSPLGKLGARMKGLKPQKNKPFKIRLIVEFFFNTNGGGIAAGVGLLDPTVSSEFVDCEAIFDEFRCTGGKFVFAPSLEQDNSAGSLQNLGVICYDSSDGGAIGSVPEGAQELQHLLWAKATQPAGKISLTPSSTHTFTWRVPTENQTLGSAAVTLPAGRNDWQPTTGGASIRPYGYMKVYATGGSSYTALSGVLYYDCEFRCRS